MDNSQHWTIRSAGLVAVCAALLALPVTPAVAGVLAGPITNPANGHLYSLLDSRSWLASEAEAITLGGHLVTVNNAAENDWLVDTFVPLLPTDGAAPTLWIGLNDAAHEGVFVWASGEAVTYTHWQAPQQPDNARGNEDYAHIWTPGQLPNNPELVGQWNDAENTGSLIGRPFGVVEVVPEPATGALMFAGLALLGALVQRMRPTRADRR